MKINLFALSLLGLFFFSRCTSSASRTDEPKKDSVTAKATVEQPLQPTVMADAATVLSRKEVPILCYHDIRNFRPGESERMKSYVVPIQSFKDQIKMLADSGFHTITPDQYYAYLTTGAPLPPKPVMITFDDNDEVHYSIGAAELNKYNFKGVFFIMTITIGRPNYMSKEQLKELSGQGHVIATHTWDHHKVTKYTEEDWKKQLDESRQKLQEITGKPVDYFAYPFGLWNDSAVQQLKQRGIKAAFQLAPKRSPQEPLYTLRRMLVHGSWNTDKVRKWMKVNFPGSFDADPNAVITVAGIK